MDISVKDFNRCCRCCLMTADNMKPIFGACLNGMLIKLMKLQVTPIDGLPQQICFRCVLKLSSAYTFYLTVQKNQNILEDILKTAVENGEIPAKVTSSGENKESNTLEKGDTVKKEHSVYEAACKPPSDPPKETIRSKQTSASRTSSHRWVNYGTPESEELTDKEENYQCPQCKHSSKDEEHLKVHLQTHVGAKSECKGETDVYPQLCNICGARFRLRTSLYKHLRQHRGRPRCPHCNKTFAEASTLKVHLVSHSSEKKPYRCNMCPRAFSQRASREQHARRHGAGGREPLACDQCDKSFLHKYSLFRHRESAHSIHECTVCKKLFAGKKLLDMHMRYHKKKEMECSNTERPADNVPTESIDIQTVTVEFLCLLCTTKFQTRESLEVHMCTKENIT